MRDRSVLFWDFDGVIKESVVVKTDAYVGLFASYGADIAERVRRHHESNGGMSRYEKIPLYLTWAGLSPTSDVVANCCRAFSEEVYQRVVDCSWVPGAREYLASNYERQRFVVVTGTPQDEMEQILRHLDISHWFREVHGAPADKAEAIRSVLERWRCPNDQALMIGDSRSDYLAACASGVDFLLRRTPLNGALQREFRGHQCRDFAHE